MSLLKPRRLMLSAGVTVLVVCGLSLRPPAHAVQARTHDAASSTIIVDYTNDFSTLDTGKCYDGQCYPFMRAMYDRLVDYDTRHGTGTALIPDAAAMPAISNGGTTYTFALRHDVHFWNGRLVTSADWVYSFERIINPKTQAGAAAFWNNIVGAKEYAAGKAPHVSGIKTLGQFGLEIDLVSSDASFLNVLAMPFGSVVDKNQIAKYGKSYSQLHPMGTGPYMLQSYQLGQQLMLVKNPHYFDPARVGHVDRIEADLGVNTETAFLRIQRGQADLDGDEPSIPAAEFLSVRQDPTWSKQLTRQVLVGTWYISMNVQMKPFDNVLVRRAVNLAINKPLLVRLVNGRATVTNTFLPPAMPGHGSFNLYPYNPAKARQLMAQAGYAHGVSTTFLTDNISDDLRVSQAIIPMLAQIGIKATLREVDSPTWSKLVGTKQKVAITWSQYYMDFPDPNDFFEPGLSCASAVPGTYNESWYCDPSVDALAHRLKSMTDRAARLRQYPRLDMMMMRDAPIVPVMNPIHYDIHSLALHNYYYNTVWELVFADYTK